MPKVMKVMSFGYLRERIFLRTQAGCSRQVWVMRLFGVRSNTRSWRRRPRRLWGRAWGPPRSSTTCVSIRRAQHPARRRYRSSSTCLRRTRAPSWSRADRPPRRRPRGAGRRPRGAGAGARGPCASPPYEAQGRRPRSSPCAAVSSRAARRPRWPADDGGAPKCQRRPLLPPRFSLESRDALVTLLWRFDPPLCESVTSA